MFKLAVVGPIITRGFGVARHCLTCQYFQAAHGDLPCFGFGPGCLAYRPPAAPSQAPAVAADERR